MGQCERNRERARQHHCQHSHNYTQCSPSAASGSSGSLCVSFELPTSPRSFLQPTQQHRGGISPSHSIALSDHSVQRPECDSQTPATATTAQLSRRAHYYHRNRNDQAQTRQGMTTKAPRAVGGRLPCQGSR